MDGSGYRWYFSDMERTETSIPSWQLYGEKNVFPDVLHIERIVDRAAGLDWAIGAHRHVHLHQLFLLISGDIRMSIDGAKWPVTPPAVINVPRGVVHDFDFSAGTDGFVVTLPADDFPELFSSSSETGQVLTEAQSHTASADVIECFEALAKTHTRMEPFRRTRLRTSAAALVCEVLDCLASGGQHRAPGDARIERFAELARQNLSAHMSVEHYARELGMSPRNLSRLCRKVTGLSAQPFLEAQAIREACRLLAYTRMSVQQVAYQLGFEDPSYFSRTFRRSVKLSPGEYRKRLNG